MTNLTNGQRFIKVFPSNLFPVNAFPMKPTINSSKFYSSNFLTCLIRQILSDFSTVKVLRYTVRKVGYYMLLVKVISSITWPITYN